MAEVDMGRGGDNRRGRPTRRNLRVDFTPMVDMNMLLITFFMFCTTLSIPQVMDIVIPTKDRIDGGGEIAAERTITLLLGEENKIYYYQGKLDYENKDLLKVTDYSAEGLRDVLLDKNSSLNSKAIALRKKRRDKEISESEFKTQMSELKKSKESAVVVIKPLDSSSYENLVDVLDEMQVCSIGKYAIVDAEDGDMHLLDSYKDSKLTAKL